MRNGIIGILLISQVAIAKESQRFEIQVDRKPVIESTDIQTVKALQSGSDWYLALRLTKVGSKKIAAATKKNIGKIMDVVIHDQIRSSPNVQAEIKSGEIIVYAHFSEQEAKSLANEFSAKAPSKK